MSCILLKNAYVLKPDNTVEKTDIAIEGANIASIGEVNINWHPDRVIDCNNKFAVPGFINTHTHAAMSMFRSYADDMLLMDWLQNKIWPIEEKLTAEDVYWGSLLAIAEMIKSGTTTFADMYFYMSQTVTAACDSGMRAVLSRGIVGVGPNAAVGLEEGINLFKEYNGAVDGRISVMLGPHAPYTCPPDFLKKVIAAAQKLNANIHIHLAETQWEVDECSKQYGMSPIALMNEVGILDLGVLAAHCVHVTPADIAIMREKNVRIAHNPGSNTKLACGIAPIPEMLASGLCVGLGTDSAASNNNHDMHEEMRLAALLHKVNKYDATIIPASTALSMATAEGANALGLNGITGKLQQGYKADITLFDVRGLCWAPCYDLVSLLVYSGHSSDVHTVLINGKVVLENKILTTIDEERLIAEVNARGLKFTDMLNKENKCKDVVECIKLIACDKWLNLYN